MAVPNVNDFKTNLPGAGARANLFQVELKESVTGMDTSFWVKAGQIPGSTIAILPVNHGGRVLKIPGLRTFDDWTCTVINDEEMKIKRTMINWMMEMAGDMDGQRNAEIVGTRVTGGNIYKTQDITIKQFDQEGSLMQRYTMHEAWPNAIADTPVDWGTDGLQEFTLTFSYDYWSHATVGATSINSLGLEGTTKAGPKLPT